MYESTCVSLAQQFKCHILVFAGILIYCHTLFTCRSSIYGNAHGNQIKKDSRPLTDKGTVHITNYKIP